MAMFDDKNVINCYVVVGQVNHPCIGKSIQKPRVSYFVERGMKLWVFNVLFVSGMVTQILSGFQQSFWKILLVFVHLIISLGANMCVILGTGSSCPADNKRSANILNANVNIFIIVVVCLFYKSSRPSWLTLCAERWLNVLMTVPIRQYTCKAQW